MAKRRPYRDQRKKELSNTTSELFKGKRVGGNWQRFITTGSVEDEDSAPTTIAFGIARETNIFTPLEEEPDPEAGVRYHIDKTHRLNPGERPAFRVEGGTSGDTIAWFLEGYEERIE